MSASTTVNGSVRQWKRYQIGEPTAVKWLSAIPSHWDVMQFKRVAWIRYGLGQPPPETQDGVPLIRATNIAHGEITDAGMMLIDPKEVPPGKNATLAFNEIIVVRSGAYTGDSAIVPQRFHGAIAGYDMVATIKRGSAPFFAWQLLSREIYDLQFGFVKLRAAQPHLNAEELGRTVVVVPPLDEQCRIVAFLDRETAKIDALSAKKERLIELLQEKRIALIGHAVTKGVNPEVPMKDSGAEWLGKIPARWGVIQSRRVFKVRNEPAAESDEQLTASQKYGMLPQTKFMEREGRRVVVTIKGVDSLRHVEPNDFVISLRSFQGGIEWSKLRGSVTFHYVVLKPVKEIYPAYFGHLFKSSVYIQALKATADFIRDGQDLRYSHFALVPIPVIPMGEQAAIASFLDQETARLDSLINVTQKTIELLHEYRTALISAAVTGKIDVREEALP